MRLFLLVPFLLCIWFRGTANQNKGYVSSKQGVTIFVEGGWDSAQVQKLLDDDLNFIIEHIAKSPELKIFIVLGAYGVHTSYRRKNSSIFVSVAYDSFASSDTLYDESPGRDGWQWFGYSYRPDEYRFANDMYPGNFLLVSPYLKGHSGLKIYYHDIWDTVNYYNHLLSIVDYAIKHIDEIKKEQKRICFPANLKDWEISILTYDTGKLKSIPIKDWGFNVDPQKRISRKSPALIIYSVVLIAALVFVLFIFLQRKSQS